MATQSVTAAPAPNPDATGNAPDLARPASPSPPPAPASPPPPPAGAARPMGTAAGGYAPPDPGRTSSSPWTRSPPTPATTATKPAATIPGSSSGTCPRSGTLPAPVPSAGGPLSRPTSSTTPRTKQADERVSVTAGQSAGTTTGSN